jgi:hypothetical protein
VSRDVSAAEHESAHVVVGMALGLRVRRVALGSVDAEGWYSHGFTWFRGSSATHRFALGVMYCAGVAWEAEHGDTAYAAADREIARDHLKMSRHDYRTGVRIADEILRARAKVHRRVVRELLDRDLGPKDVAALALGG